MNRSISISTFYFYSRGENEHQARLKWISLSDKSAQVAPLARAQPPRSKIAFDVQNETSNVSSDFRNVLRTGTLWFDVQSWNNEADVQQLFLTLLIQWITVRQKRGNTNRFGAQNIDKLKYAAKDERGDTTVGGNENIPEFHGNRARLSLCPTLCRVSRFDERACCWLTGEECSRVYDFVLCEVNCYQNAPI